VAVETQRGLALAIGPVVAVAAFSLDLGVRLADRPGMMSFSMLAARAAGASGEASNTNNSAFAQVRSASMQPRSQYT
jgi:hypothetical protein